MRMEVKTFRAVWAVSQTLHPGLEPVVLAVHTGVASVQDYLTPVQARELAANLVAVADAVEADQ